MSVILQILIFIPICFVTSAVCTALKLEGDDDTGLWKDTLKLFGMLTIGIALFCVVIYVVTVIAGSEFGAVW